MHFTLQKKCNKTYSVVKKKKKKTIKEEEKNPGDQNRGLDDNSKNCTYADYCGGDLTSLEQLEGERLVDLDLLLKLKKAVEQSLGGRGAPWNIDVNWHNPIAASHHRI